jgi:hypothetical protein
MNTGTQTKFRSDREKQKIGKPAKGGELPALKAGIASAGDT